MSKVTNKAQYFKPTRKQLTSNIPQGLDQQYSLQMALNGMAFQMDFNTILNMLDRNATIIYQAMGQDKEDSIDTFLTKAAKKYDFMNDPDVVGEIDEANKKLNEKGKELVLNLLKLRKAVEIEDIEGMKQINKDYNKIYVELYNLFVELRKELAEKQSQKLKETQQEEVSKDATI